MNSEKVKEIKNNIIICSTKIECKGCSLFPNMKSTNCRNKLLADALTLISELESENERLNKALVENLEAYKDGFNEGAVLKKGVDNKLKTENQQLKDRIAELEKEIEENAFYSKGYAQGIKNTYEVVIPEKLKQFAERLKEHPTMKIYSLHNACERIPKAIDETLKEYEQ